MTTPINEVRKWNERPSAPEAATDDPVSMFEHFFERSADPIWIFHPAGGVFLDCNQAAVKLMRAASKADLLALRPEELSPPGQPDVLESARRVVAPPDQVRHPRNAKFEWVVRRLDGSELPLQVQTTPIQNQGRQLHVIVSRDISLRKQAEAAARKSEQLLASIADNISEALYRTGPDHELIFANRAWLRLSGYASLEEMRQVARETLYANPADRGRLLQLLARDGAFRNQEIEYTCRDGRHWWGLTNSVAIRDPQTGTVLYHVGSVADITERRRAADEIQRLNAALEQRIAERTAELTASEARLRTLVEHAPEAIVVFDGDTGRFINGNDRACELFGCGTETLPQLTPEAVSPEFQADGQPTANLAREKIDEALAGETPVFEWMHCHSSGRLIPTEVRLVRLPGDRPRLIRASIIDNSERKRREAIQRATFQISEAAHTAGDLDALFADIHAIVKTLVAAENFYIALMDPGAQTFSVPYFVDEWDPNPGPLRLDQGLSGLVLRTGQPLLAKGANLRRQGDGRAVLVEPGCEQEYFESGAQAAVWLGAPLTIRGRTIGVVAVQNYQAPSAYGEEAKRLLTFVGGQIALAIERKRAEQALRESEGKFRALFEASSLGVMLHDENQYLEVNSAALRMLGYQSASELVGRHPSDTSPSTQAHGEPTDALAAKYIQECVTRGHARFEWLAQRATGEIIPLEVILTRIEWGGRQIIQAVINDISERKRAEAELLRSLAREQELGQLKSRFVSMVSHEFRTPLGIIQSSAEILSDYLEQLGPEDRRAQLESIVKNTRRMANLMEEVLVLGRLDAGKMDFKPTPLDPGVLCERIMDEVCSATDRRCPLALDCAVVAGAVQADESLLRHILTNLLSNAVKFSKPNSPVRLEVGREAEEVVFTVRDAGAGIPEADLPWLFNAFQRGRNVGQVPGTGLGLTIVKRCVELHRGRINIESKLGEGTTVTVRLPGQTIPNE